MTLENITGNLLQAYKQCVPSTMLCVDQLTNERRINLDLRNQSFYTADGEVYSVDGETPTLRMTREATNPILNNIDDAFAQSTQNYNYKVIPADFDAVKTAADTVTIDLTKLTLQGGGEWYYLAISTSKPSLMKKGYNKLNAEERKLAERVYGQGTDFVDNMKMLNNAGIIETKVYVLNPDYVKEHAKEGAIGRASWLNNFGYNSNFDADDRSIDNDYRVRGVRREVERREPVMPEGRGAKLEAPLIICLRYLFKLR